MIFITIMYFLFLYVYMSIFGYSKTRQNVTSAPSSEIAHKNLFLQIILDTLDG